MSDQKYHLKYSEGTTKRLDWCKRHLNKYWHKVFFTYETTVYFDNPSGLKWVKSDVNYTEHKR